MKTLFAVTIAAGTLLAQEPASDKFERFVIQSQIEANIETNKVEGKKLSVTTLVNGPIVKNAPYSAEAVTETVRVLSDGNRIESKSTTKIYRDSQGRERREEAEGQVFINDPVKGMNFMLRTDAKVAERRGNMFLFSTDSGQSLQVGGKMVWTHTAGSQVLMLNKGADQSLEPVEQQLGTRSIEGVQAEGRRTTVTIPAGEIGNVRPIEIVDERWFSADLQAIVYSRHSDPREGVTEYRLLNISRVEQPLTLFEVPADFTVPEGMKRDILRLNEAEKGVIRLNVK